MKRNFHLSSVGVFMCLQIFQTNVMRACGLHVPPFFVSVPRTVGQPLRVSVLCQSGCSLVSVMTGS